MGRKTKVLVIGKDKVDMNVYRWDDSLFSDFLVREAALGGSAELSGPFAAELRGQRTDTDHDAHRRVRPAHSQLGG